MGYAKRQDVEQFLASFHSATQSGIYFIDRKKNFEFLLLHGMSDQDRKDVIANLCVEDYFSGPELDKDFPHQPPCIWKFCVTLEGVEIYIKLKLVKDGSIMRAKGLSFHEPEHPISHFPYKR